MFFIDTRKSLFSNRYLSVLSCLLVANFFMADAVAQVSSQVESDDPTLVQRLTHGKKDIDCANMDIEFASSGAGSFTDWSLDDFSFNIDRIRLNITGAFNDKFSYNFRQSFNKYTSMNVPIDNLQGNLELANIGWQMSNKFHLLAGKQAVQFSGQEFWVNAIKVRDYSDFFSTGPAYMTGVTLAYNYKPNQTLNFQVVNNTLGKLNEEFQYGLTEDIKDPKAPILATVNWDGKFMDNALGIRYSFSYAQQAKNKNAFYFTSGHVWDKKPIVAYLDLLYTRQALDSKGFISEATAKSNQRTIRNVDYFTAIANIDYRIAKHWNIYAKGTYEQGNVYKSYEDTEAGTYRKTWDIQLCAEYFPMPQKDLLVYLHLMYKNVHLTERAKVLEAEGYSQQRISLGIVYTLPVF